MFVNRRFMFFHFILASFSVTSNCFDSDSDSDFFHLVQHNQFVIFLVSRFFAYFFLPCVFFARRIYSFHFSSFTGPIVAAMERPARIPVSIVKSFLGNPNNAGGPEALRLVADLPKFVERHPNIFCYDDATKRISLLAGDTGCSPKVVKSCTTLNRFNCFGSIRCLFVNLPVDVNPRLWFSWNKYLIFSICATFYVCPIFTQPLKLWCIKTQRYSFSSLLPNYLANVVCFQGPNFSTSDKCDYGSFLPTGKPQQKAEQRSEQKKFSVRPGAEKYKKIWKLDTKLKNNHWCDVPKFCSGKLWAQISSDSRTKNGGLFSSFFLRPHTKKQFWTTFVLSLCFGSIFACTKGSEKVLRHRSNFFDPFLTQ